MTLIAGTLQSFKVAINEMQEVRSPKSVYAWMKQVKFDAFSNRNFLLITFYYVLISLYDS